MKAQEPHQKPCSLTQSRDLWGNQCASHIAFERVQIVLQTCWSMPHSDLHTCVSGKSSHQTFPLPHDACPHLRIQGGLVQLSRPSTGRSLTAPPPHLPAACSNTLCKNLETFTIQSTPIKLVYIFLSQKKREQIKNCFMYHLSYSPLLCLYTGSRGWQFHCKSQVTIASSGET